MDEPNALTDTETKYLFRVIHELKLQRRDIIYNISPYKPYKEIFYICDDVTVFRDEPFIEMVRYKLEIDQYLHLDNSLGEIHLKVDNLCGLSVNDVSFVLRKGDILGISGLMGGRAH